ncbi:uncharacterized protein [Anas platyrhynchos]|uniref:uncharacterized protein isoform X2 n=1 Tax=Anas platyrhynchos TaxID=8839 RepID=UPI003AF274D1
MRKLNVKFSLKRKQNPSHETGCKYKQQEEVRTKKMTVKMFQGVTTFDGGNLLTATKLLWKAVRQRDRERTNSGQPCSVRQKESLENAGSQKCRRRARQRHADDISDSTPSCSSPLLSTCDTEESGESSEDSESTSPRRTFRVKLQKQDLKRVQRDQKKVGGSQGDAMQIDSAVSLKLIIVSASVSRDYERSQCAIYNYLC